MSDSCLFNTGDIVGLHPDCCDAKLWWSAIFRIRETVVYASGSFLPGTGISSGYTVYYLDALTSKGREFLDSFPLAQQGQPFEAFHLVRVDGLQRASVRILKDDQTKVWINPNYYEFGHLQDL